MIEAIIAGPSFYRALKLTNDGPAHPDQVDVTGTPEQIAEWRKRQLEAYEAYWRERGLRGSSHL